MAIADQGYSSFGTLLKAFRLRQHLTQQMLAEVLGIHRRSLVRWEQGDYLPESKAMVLELARHLHLDNQESRHLLEASLTALAPYWLVPLPRNPFFTGREDMLEALHAQLDVEQAIALTQSAALHGLGGVGKTQIALEYAYRHSLDYRAVFWIGAETQEQIVSSLLRIAEVLQLPGQDGKDQQRVVVAVQRWLSTHSQWLLIWDNVEDLALLDYFLPATRPGACLITTRSQMVGTFAQGLDLLPMEQEEGVLFLLRRAKTLVVDATREQVRQFATQRPSLFAEASELVVMLGGLPLALDQAGAYIEETGCSFVDYLQRYERQHSYLLSRRGPARGYHPHSVTTTFHIAVEQLEREQSKAVDLLRVCAFLQADAIPEELFITSAPDASLLQETLITDLIQFDQVMVMLRRLSLIQRHTENHTFSLHRLVQVVLRARMETGAAKKWCERTLQMINAAFPEPDFPNWARCERYIPHTLVGLQFVELAGESIPEARALFSKAGSYLLERGRYDEAERVLVQARMLGEQHQQEKDIVAAKILDRLATVYWRQEKYQQAEQLFQQALALCEQRVGPNHPETADKLNNLALLYYEKGNYQQAEEFLLSALAITDSQLGPIHPDLAQTYDNVARVFGVQGKFIQAEQCYRRALTIWENLPGADHPSMTFSLNNLGMLYVEQGKYELAEPLLQRALTIRQQSLGSDHPRTAVSLHNLAWLFLQQSKYEEALQMVQRALLILEQRAGSDNFYLAKALKTLGMLYQGQRKYEQAEPLFVRALTIQEHLQGPCHPETARMFHDLAIFRQEQGNVSEALSLAKRAHSIRSQALGETHPQTVVTQALYDRLLQEQAAVQKEGASVACSKGNLNLHGEECCAEEASRVLPETVDPSSSENDPLRAFLDARCVLHSRAWCRSSDLWHAYLLWAEECQEQYLLSRGAFIAQLKAHGCGADRTKSTRIWRGVALVKQNDDGG